MGKHNLGPRSKELSSHSIVPGSRAGSDPGCSCFNRRCVTPSQRSISNPNDSTEYTHDRNPTPTPAARHRGRRSAIQCAGVPHDNAARPNRVAGPNAKDPRAKFPIKVAQASVTLTHNPAIACVASATRVPLFSRRGVSGTPPGNANLRLAFGARPSRIAPPASRVGPLM